MDNSTSLFRNDTSSTSHRYDLAIYSVLFSLIFVIVAFIMITKSPENTSGFNTDIHDDLLENEFDIQNESFLEETFDGEDVVVVQNQVRTFSISDDPPEDDLPDPVQETRVLTTDKGVSCETDL